MSKRKYNRLGGNVKHLLGGLNLVRFEPRQDKIDYPIGIRFRPDPQPEPGELLAPEFLDQRGQPVMAAI